MKIYLTRHGQNVDNANNVLNGHRDEPLTSIGLKQANDLADIILDKNLHIEKIFSSPLSRAHKTAEIIANKLNLPEPEINNLLIERDFGLMSGKSASEIETVCAPNIIKTNEVTYFLAPEEGETFPELIIRAEKMLKFLEEGNYNENILLVCHGDIGKMLYAVFYKLPWEEVLSSFHFGNTEIILLDNDCKEEDRHIVKIKQFNS